MGMRVRLKAGYDISGFAPEAQVILQRAEDVRHDPRRQRQRQLHQRRPDPRWDDDKLRQLKRVKTQDLEVVEMRDIVVGPAATKDRDERELARPKMRQDSARSVPSCID